MSLWSEAWDVLREDVRGLLSPRRLAPNSDLRADPAQRLPHVDWQWRLGVLLTLAAFAAYLWVGRSFVAGSLYKGYNVLFDLDSPRFVLLFAKSRELWDAGTHALDYRVKHPFFLALRLPGRLLVELGLTPETAVALLLALAGAATVACAWAALRLFSVGLAESVVLTVFFAVSCAQLFYATIIESYGFAAASIAWLHVAALMRWRGRWGHPRGRFLSALVTFGITSTNVAQAGLVEIAVWLRRVSPRRAALRSASYGALLLALGALLVGLAYPSAARLYLDPAMAVKRVKWIGVLQEEDIPKGGPARELATFGAYAFVAPRVHEVPIERGAKSMLDIRRPDYTPRGWAALALWLALLLGGAVALARDHDGRLRLGLYAACVLFNVALHAVFQYRGSLFIVASHAHFALFLCAAAGAAASSRAPARLRWAVLVGLIALTVLTALENGARLAWILAQFPAA